MIPRSTYIASCSFGKDSIATILLALEHDEPLDRVVFSEVMLDQLRGQVDRITASADRYKLKEQRKEYLARAGAQLKHTQIAELEFLLQ